jgi:hypothetical protein
MHETVELLRDRVLHLGVDVAGVENGDAAREIDVALPLHVPELRVGSAVRVDGQRIRDPARNGILPALVQFGIRRQDGFSRAGGETYGILSEFRGLRARRERCRGWLELAPPVPRGVPGGRPSHAREPGTLYNGGPPLPWK